MMFTPDNVSALSENQIFVFPSNTAGIHGAGAALIAKNKFDAKTGIGRGPTGKCYALPTKDNRLRRLSLMEIAANVEEFLVYADANKHMQFLLTRIGCGLVGYEPLQMAHLFCHEGLCSNIVYPIEFHNHIVSCRTSANCQ